MLIAIASIDTAQPEGFASSTPDSNETAQHVDGMKTTTKLSEPNTTEEIPERDRADSDNRGNTNGRGSPTIWRLEPSFARARDQNRRGGKDHGYQRIDFFGQ